MSDGEDGGGDPACWSHLVCVNCGRVLDESDRARNSDDDPYCRDCGDVEISGQGRA